MPTLSIRDQVRNIVDPMFLSLREALYGSGVTYNNYIARSTIPPATDTGTGGVKLSNATPLDVTTLLVSAGVSNDVARADHKHKLDATGVASGTYGDATHIPRITVDQSGRITFASGIAFSGGGSVTYVGLIPPASGITVVGSPITSSGSFIISLANDLAALENLTGSGVAVRTGIDTWILQRPLNQNYGGTGTSTIFTLGSVIFAGASGIYSEDNANFFYNDTTNCLGAGTNSPSERLHVVGKIRAASGIIADSFENKGIPFVEAATKNIVTDANQLWYDDAVNILRVGSAQTVTSISRLALTGTDSSTGGPHFSMHTGTDSYPLIQLLGWSHDNISLNFDSYWDGVNWKSSDSGSNFQFRKNGDNFSVFYDTGILQGNNITWNEALRLATTGDFTAFGSITLNNGAGKLQMKNISALANNGLAQLAISAAAHALAFILNDNAQMSLYYLRGGVNNVTELLDPSTAYTPTAGGAGTTNIYWSIANSRYEIENKTGAARTYRVFFFQA